MTTQGEKLSVSGYCKEPPYLELEGLGFNPDSSSYHGTLCAWPQQLLCVGVGHRTVLSQPPKVIVGSK